ncbi:MAG TPA: hypothetical protein VK837_08935 [Longimicrobiales bacterium]|nr:hypothetical protein [Longimicrobiales bacterium]
MFARACPWSVVALLVGLPGCGDRDAPSEGPPRDEALGDRGVPADGIYARELIFLADEGRRALVLVSRAAVSGGAASLRAAAWVDPGSGWDRAFEGSREFAELRDPWRLFPLRPMRVAVDEEGALLRVLLPSSQGDIRLSPDTPPTELAAGNARASMRGASMVTPDDSIVGTLVDGMFASSASDSAGPALVGVLTSTGGPIVVIVGSDQGAPLLVADVGGDALVESQVRLEPGMTQGEWRIVSADTSIAGTLQTGAEAPAEAGGWPPAAVSGRIALAGTLYPLAGVLRAPTP